MLHPHKSFFFGFLFVLFGRINEGDKEGWEKGVDTLCFDQMEMRKGTGDYSSMPYGYCLMWY